MADDYEPTVTVVTPMYNEGEGIRDTIRSVLAQDYPAHKLSLVVVDDASTDLSLEYALDEARGENRVTVLRNEANLGKRRSINRAVRLSTAEIIVSVDSDVTVDRRAVRELVRRFTGPEVAAVGGQVDIRNKQTNWLTRMQSVKYFFGYHTIKNLERAYRTVLCLSGCLTAYRRSVLVELEPILERRKIKYGEDRFLTRQIIKAGYKTTMTMDALCHTRAPREFSHYVAQQLRWRRSTIVDYLGSVSHFWRMHPLVALHYYAVFGAIIMYPILLVSAAIGGWFLQLMALHLVVVMLFGLYYYSQVRGRPADQRVSAASFLPMAFVLPISYAVLPLLAAFTLGTKSWSTRRRPRVAIHASAPAPALAAVRKPTAAREIQDGSDTLHPAPVRAATNYGG
ncbi:MAG: glycosyltransferase [bacterium]